MNSWIAYRFTLRGTDRGHFSPLTLFAWIAIGLGVAAMTGLISVMYGFETSLKNRVLTSSPHIFVRGKGREILHGFNKTTKQLNALSGVDRAVPFVESEMIATSPEKTIGVVVWGLPQSEIARFTRGLKTGRLPDYQGTVPEALLGDELAHRLQIANDQNVQVVSPTQMVGSFGMMPIQGTFRVSGSFASGHLEADQGNLYLFLEDAQELLRMNDAIHGWQIWGRSIDEASVLARKVRMTLGDGYDVQSWEDFNSALFQSLKLEQFAMFSILSLAVFVAVLNVGITLAMHVTYKRRNIGILRSLGASEAVIRKIFVWQGFWLGAVGMALGAVLTAAFFVYVRYFSQYQLPDIYYDRSLPIEVRPIPTLIIYLVCSALVLIATVIPARAASQMDPIAAIRE
ncbi:MAG: FtsX-like permease family protein [Deltaproteobacteria bacterium]|nr:FtsX-like permease family protein [Deltaproteobacteria bacterium]